MCDKITQYTNIKIFITSHQSAGEYFLVSACSLIGLPPTFHPTLNCLSRRKIASGEAIWFSERQIASRSEKKVSRRGNLLLGESKRLVRESASTLAATTPTLPIANLLLRESTPTLCDTMMVVGRINADSPRVGLDSRRNHVDSLRY